MKKVAIFKSKDKFYLLVNENKIYLGEMSDGATVILDEAMETLNEEDALEYEGLFIEQ